MEVWLADTEKLSQIIREDKIHSALTDEENARAMRYVRLSDRLNFAIGRLMIRMLAQQSFGDWNAKISISEYGKPYFANSEAPAFSLSHSKGIVALLHDSYTVGIDIESCDDKNWREIASHLDEKEQKAIWESDDPQDRFYMIWTIREAFSKLIGKGLSFFDDGHSLDINFNKGMLTSDNITASFKSWTENRYRISISSSHIDDLKVVRISGEMLLKP